MDSANGFWASRLVQLRLARQSWSQERHTIHDEWQTVESGDKIPAGPSSFTATIVDSPHHFVLEIQSLGKKSPKLHFTLAYELRDDPQGTRLVTRMRSRIKLPLGSVIEKVILGPGDGIMLRRQLLTIRKNLSL